jgi:hypothetical protein
MLRTTDFEYLRKKHIAFCILFLQVIKLIEGGLQLSEYQARKAFSVYLNCILQRLSDFDDASGDIGQVRSKKPCFFSSLVNSLVKLRN